MSEDKEEIQNREYCPFPGRDCFYCTFMWMNVCLIAKPRRNDDCTMEE